MLWTSVGLGKAGLPCVMGLGKTRWKYGCLGADTPLHVSIVSLRVLTNGLYALASGVLYHRIPSCRGKERTVPIRLMLNMMSSRVRLLC